MGPPSYMRSVVDRNVVMQRIPVLSCGGRVVSCVAGFSRVVPSLVVYRRL